MLEYELYVPLHHNDGRPIDPQKLKDLKKRLVDEFGGLTHLRQEHEGLWKIGDHTFRDRVEILLVALFVVLVFGFAWVFLQQKP